MTRAVRILCSLLLALAIAAPAAAQPGSFKLPPYKKVILRNGMTLLLMEQHEVPLVSFSVIVKAGSVSDPAGKEGVASMTAALLRKGTATRNSDDFSAQLDFIGGSFGAGASQDATVISAEFMKKDLAKGLELLADAMLHPSFPGDEVKKLAAQRVDGIKSAKDRAAGVIGSTSTRISTADTRTAARPAATRRPSRRSRGTMWRGSTTRTTRPPGP